MDTITDKFFIVIKWRYADDTSNETLYTDIDTLKINYPEFYQLACQFEHIELQRDIEIITIERY